MNQNNTQPMNRFLIQRDLPAAGELDGSQLVEISRNSCKVLNEMGDGIRWLHSYVTKDAIYCVYDAVNEELLYKHAEICEIPITEVFQVNAVISPETANDQPRLAYASAKLRNYFAKALLLLLVALLSTGVIWAQKFAAPSKIKLPHLFMDVHRFKAGTVKFADVKAAHEKDLAVQQKYGVQFINYWVDEEGGKVYCLVAANDSLSIIQAHKEAHGLLPSQVYQVTEGSPGALATGLPMFMDFHRIGEGKVTAAAVAEAHTKDLAVQKQFGVNCVNYWVDEKAGVIFCLAQAKEASGVIQTHKTAHGLLPEYINEVKQGQ